jgi:L-amino acid N-acyltransferase YncA
VKPTDEPLLKDLFYSLSEKSIYQRFMAMKVKMPHRELQPFANIDYDTEMALVGIIREKEVSKMIAVSRYILNKNTGTAEVSFIVSDDWQDRGIGSYLLEYMVRIAKQRGIKAFTAEVLPQNMAMLHVFHSTGLKVQTEMEDGSYSVYIDLMSKEK